MKQTAILVFAMVGILFATQTMSAQPDLAREQRMAEQIVDAIFDGEPFELEAQGNAFLAIHTETDADTPKGNVLILHGRGFHPDWATVVQPLRVGLVGHGWNTLSIQMPVLDKAAKYFDYVDIFDDAGPRIEAALAYLRENNDGPIVIVAHSCGSHMAQHWIHQGGEDALSKFDAYVGIGMGATDYRQPMVEPFALEKMKMPVLDVYGEEDYPAVLRMARERSDMIWRGANPKSRQEMVPGAGHYFEEMGEELTDVIAQWLDTL